MDEFLRSVALVALLRMAAGLLLPEGALRKLCDMLLGLVTTLCMMGALSRLLSGWKG